MEDLTVGIKVGVNDCVGRTHASPCDGSQAPLPLHLNCCTGVERPGKRVPGAHRSLASMPETYSKIVLRGGLSPGHQETAGGNTQAVMLCTG